MKNCIPALLLLFAITSCTVKGNFDTAKNNIAGSPVTNDTVRIANDSLEYEIIIIDNGFNAWLKSRAQKRGYYSQPYLENKNRMWVTEWNIRSQQPQRYGANMYQMRIDYENNVNYGYEVNYLLYNYLVYFQNVNRQRLGGLVPEF